MAANLDLVTIQHPFLTVDHICFFLQKSYWQVRDRTASLYLTPAKTVDGTEFMPAGRAVYRAIDVEPLLDASAREVFVRWQHGEVDVPPLRANRQPLPLNSAIPTASGQ